MEKGRSDYRFEINCDINLMNTLLQRYIQANNFILENNNNEKYYKSGDAMIGYRYFNYSFIDNTLIISAWFKGKKDEFKIEQKGLIGSLNIYSMDYKNSLNSLFQEINKLNMEGRNMNNNLNNQDLQQDMNSNLNNQDLQQNMNSNLNNQDLQQNMNSNLNNQYAQQNANPQYSSQNTINSMQQTTNTNPNLFQDDLIKKKEKVCEIGFWISILGLVSSFAGIVMGIFVYILDFYFASQGLKTRKRGKAIATIIMSILSIIISILMIIF